MSTAFITGAASGLGCAIARRLADDGCAIVAVDRDRAALDRVVADLAATGARVTALQVDVTDFDAMQRAGEQAEAFGAIDRVVAVAGITSFGEAHSMGKDQWDQMISINLTGVWHTARHLLGPMLERGHGSIVNIASVAGQVGLPGTPHYSAAKGGVIALTRQMAMEYADRGIRVNAVAPGEIPTPMLTAAFMKRALRAGRTDTEVAVERILGDRVRDYPMGRLGTPEDIADCVAWLSGDEASWVTGQTITVDGGFTTR